MSEHNSCQHSVRTLLHSAEPLCDVLVLLRQTIMLATPPPPAAFLYLFT